MKRDSKVYVAGHAGMVGSALVRSLEEHGYSNVVVRTHAELDLTTQADVDAFFRAETPHVVVVAAAMVGGIAANSRYRADFIYENLAIATNVMHAAHQYEAAKCIFFGSSCIYPRDAAQPIKEEYLLTGKCEPTNEPFAIAKIAGIKLCQSYYEQHGANFYSIVPANMYGPADNLDAETSHVMAALLRKFHEAKREGQRVVTLWGTGEPLREFLYVEDAAEACVHLVENVDARDVYDQGISHLNLGTGEDISILALAGLVAEVVGFKGVIETDPSHPDGTPRKLLDSSRINELGWRSRTAIKDGVRLTYDWCLSHSDVFALGDSDIPRSDHPRAGGR